MNGSDEQKEFEKKLGLESIRDLTPEQLPALASEIPSMSKEAVLEILEQLPDFGGLMSTSLDQVQSGTNSILAANWLSQKMVHSGLAEYRAVIDRELQRENLDVEDRYRLLDMFREAVEREARVDQDHKNFALKAVATLATAGAFTAVTAVALLGGKLSSRDQNES